MMMALPANSGQESGFVGIGLWAGSPTSIGCMPSS